MTEAQIIGANKGEIIFKVPSTRDGYHIVTYADIETEHNMTIVAPTDDGNINQIKHTVTTHQKGWKCTCEHYKYRKGYCRHMKEAKALLNELNENVQGCESTL